MPPQWDQYPIAGPYKELQQEQGDCGHCQPVRPPSRKADGGTESPAILQGCRRGIRDHPEAKLDEPFKREWPKTCSGLSVRARRHATDIPFFLCFATGIPRWARVIPSKQGRDTKVTNPPGLGHSSQRIAKKQQGGKEIPQHHHRPNPQLPLTLNLEPKWLRLE